MMQAPARPLLILREPRGSRQQWVIDKSEVVLGRSEGCDVQLPGRAVSRRHARILQTDGGYLLADLDSKNGTFVNGQEVVASYLLRDGDEIQIALAVRLLFVAAEATAPLEAGVPILPEGRLRLDADERRVRIGTQDVAPPLSPAQFTLLRVLYRAEGRVVGREEIVRSVWPDTLAEGISDQAIDALVRRLRGRLGQIDEDHEYVVTVRGHGFRFRNRDEG
jgi:pSer/pThr/pTyr-binding forkhead associated (FHA) protein